ncbi:MAG: DNA primase [Clostridia bacterium]|nr:DNA primase [Clostridia bacterium]
MTAAFSQDVINEVRDRVDIVDIIGGQVRLKKRGRNYVGLCPFHSEKTPSFTVSPDKQMFYCFGCGVGGNVFTFLMKQNGLSFPEAVKTLAARAGIDLVDVEEAPAQRQQREFKERLYQLGAIAASFYCRILTGHLAAAPAREYIRRRGLKDESVRVFQLGYAPGRGEVLVKYLLSKGYSWQEIEQAGLSSSTRGDRFRNRLMFPIKDRRSRVIGFGGRVLGDGQPKYLNSPETVLFNKSKVLFGLHLALPGIRRQKQAILVEGYLDMITAWQYGLDNVVATLGTSLTREQAQELSRYAKEVIIAYDADTAGAAATLRGLDILAAAGLQVRVAQLPQGQDPDEFLTAEGPAAFKQLISSSQGLIEFHLHQALLEHDVNTPRGKQAVIALMLPQIKKVKNSVEREIYIRLLSRQTGISETAILNDLRRIDTKQDMVEKTRNTRTSQRTGEKARGTTYKTGELFLLQAYLAADPLATIIDSELGDDWGDSPLTKKLVAIIRAERDKAPGLAGEELLQTITNQGEQEIVALLAKLSLSEELGPVEERTVIKAVRFYKLQKLKKKEKELWLAMARAETGGAASQVKELQEQIFHLQQTIKAVKIGRGE